MKRRWRGYSSPLAGAFGLFLTLKRALGRRFLVEESVLRLFDRFLVEQRITRPDMITPQVIEAFLASRPRGRPRSYNHLRGTLVRFFEWAVALGHVPVSPVRASARRDTGHRVPFIFDQTSARRLLEIARALQDNGLAPCRGHTYYTIFALLYGLGLRVGEVSRLTVADVDLDRQLLVIRETKFGKTRLVPFGPRIASVLTAYRTVAETRRGPLAADAPFFSFTRRGAIHPCTITQTFHHLVPRLQLVIPDGVAAPRLHDLRQHAGSRIMPGPTKEGPFRAGESSIWRLPIRHNPVVVFSTARGPGREKTCWITSSRLATRFRNSGSLDRTSTGLSHISPRAGTPPRRFGHS